MATKTVNNYYSPRQTLTYQGLTNATLGGGGTYKIYGLDSTPTTPPTFFAISGAVPGTGNAQPLNTGVAGYHWYNSASPQAVTPLTMVGQAEEGASSHGTNTSVSADAGTVAVVWLTDIQSPHIYGTGSDGTWSLPAGDWTVRIFAQSSTVQFELEKIRIIKVAGFSSTDWIWGGPGTTVLETYTPAISTIVQTPGGGASTKSFDFTTTHATETFDDASDERLVVMLSVTNTDSRSAGTLTYRHNRNQLTPIEFGVTYDLDLAGDVSASVKTPSVAAGAVTVTAPAPADVSASVKTPSVSLSLTRTASVVDYSATVPLGATLAKQLAVTPGTNAYVVTLLDRYVFNRQVTTTTSPAQTASAAVQRMIVASPSEVAWIASAQSKRTSVAACSVVPTVSVAARSKASMVIAQGDSHV